MRSTRVRPTHSRSPLSSHHRPPPPTYRRTRPCMMNRARDNGVSVSPGAERDPRNSLGEGRVRVMRYLHAGGLGGGGCSVARWTACMTSRTFLKKVLLKQFMEIQTTFIIGSIWDHSIFHVR